MKVKVVRRFVDKYTDKCNEIGEILEVTKERYAELVDFTEEIKEVKKATKKK